jgi:hypothetical protein
LDTCGARISIHPRASVSFFSTWESYLVQR